MIKLVRNLSILLLLIFLSGCSFLLYPVALICASAAPKWPNADLNSLKTKYELETLYRFSEAVLKKRSSGECVAVMYIFKPSRPLGVPVSTFTKSKLEIRSKMVMYHDQLFEANTCSSMRIRVLEAQEYDGRLFYGFPADYTKKAGGTWSRLPARMCAPGVIV